MSHHPSWEKKSPEFIDEIRLVAGVVGCALVSCEGVVMGNYFQEDNISSSLFAAMSATVLASAEAAAGSVHMQRPSMVTITADDARILIVSVGGTGLITAAIDKSADLPTVQGQLSAIAARIGEEA